MERVILLSFEWIIGDVAPLLSLNDEIRGRNEAVKGRKIKKKEESRNKETKQENKDRRKWLSWIWHLRFIVLRSTLYRSLEYTVEKDKNVDILFIFASKSTIISPISYSCKNSILYWQYDFWRTGVLFPRIKAVLFLSWNSLWRKRKYPASFKNNALKNNSSRWIFFRSSQKLFLHNYIIIIVYL